MKKKVNTMMDKSCTATQPKVMKRCRQYAATILLAITKIGKLRKYTEPNRPVTTKAILELVSTVESSFFKAVPKRVKRRTRVAMRIIPVGVGVNSAITVRLQCDYS